MLDQGFPPPARCRELVGGTLHRLSGGGSSRGLPPPAGEAAQRPTRPGAADTPGRGRHGPARPTPRSVANLDAGLRLATKRELKLTFAPNCRGCPRSATKRGIVSAGASRRRGAGRARPNRATLTAQEAQPVELARQGLSNAEIADRLVISVRTVGTQLDRGMHKLGVRDRRDL
jgi:DNA-binding CsgD family transcriptional regulator